MKRELREWIAVLIFSSILVLAGCGGYSSTTDTDLSSSGGDGGGEGTGISNTFSSPSEMGVGDIMPIEFGASTEVSVDFSSVASDENFILIIGSNNTSGYGTSMQLSTDLALADESNVLVKGVVDDTAGEDESKDGFGPAEIFDAWLRASEDALPVNKVRRSFKAVSSSYGEGASYSVGAKAAALGETETFRVLSSLSSTSSYVEVVGEVRCLGSNVAFYVDTSVGSDILADDDIDQLCGEFDAVARDEQNLLGSISDIDGDGKLAILMTKQVNRLGALGGGIITGYFYAGDLYDRSSSNPVSNEREIIYTMVPDPEGIYGTTISKQFAMSNLLPAVLPHELQHTISYNQHVFLNDGSPEENWLNEGLSHLAEDVLGYGMENPSRYAMFLESPSSYGVVTQGSPNLMERGAAYLFLRFLYEQASDGQAFLGALENTSKKGTANIEVAYDGLSDMNGFSEYIARWVLALAMTDRGISQDRRYTYQPRVRNSSTGNWEGVCIDCDADDGRGTTLEGVHLNTYYGYHNSSIDSSAAMFYEMTTLPTTMKLSGTAGGGNFGLLIRTK